MLRIGAVRQSGQRFIVFRRRALRDVGKETGSGINRRKLLAPCLAFFRRAGDWPDTLHWPRHTERGPAATSVFPSESAHNSTTPSVDCINKKWLGNGRTACRERGGRAVEITGVGVSI